MALIYDALRPNGQLVIVDFHRIPGVSREWIFGHVRADQKTVTREVTDAGFELTNVHRMTQLKENYVLRFRKRKWNVVARFPWHLIPGYVHDSCRLGLTKTRFAV